jgi:hypothetical protein
MFLAILGFVLNPSNSPVFFKQGCYCTLLQLHTEKMIEQEKGHRKKKKKKKKEEKKDVLSTL